MPELIELKAVRSWENRLAVTTIYKGNDKYATFPAGTKQPREGSKYITINCWKFKLIWV